MNIALIVNIVSYVLLALIIGLGFLIGYKRGVKRSLIHFATNIVFVVASFLIAPFISKAITNINFNGKPLSQIIVDALSNNPDIKAAVDNSPAFRSFLEALPAVLINVVVVLVLYGFMRLLGYIVYKIIEKTTLKSKAKEAELGLKRNKWAGAGIGALKAIVFTVIFFAPITASFGFVEDIQTETKSEYETSEAEETSARVYQTASEEDDEGGFKNTDYYLSKIPTPIMDGINAFNNNQCTPEF